MVLDLTPEMIAAQCLAFYVAGHETSSSVQSYCLFELALHPEIQDRVHKEIDTVITKHGGVTYQSLMELEYLEMVIYGKGNSEKSLWCI